jgi:phage-related protein
MRSRTGKSKTLRVAILGVTPLLLVGVGARAQSQPAQDDRTFQNSDATRGELAQFNQFLDSHPDIADQLRRDPSLADNPQYLDNHPELKTFLQDHSGIREQLNQNPNAFIRQEDVSDRDRNGDRAQVGEFNRFLDGHPEIAEQLRRDPSLADKQQFLKDHPALQMYLQDHPEIRQDLRQEPNAFMRQEDNFGRNDVRLDYDARRAQLGEFNRFLSDHPEIAEQLRKDPSLADKQQFLKTHPALQTFLQNQPGVRQDLRQDPNAFMREEDTFAFDRSHAGDNGRGYDDHDRNGSFREFLGGHRDISDQLSRNPYLVKDDHYVKDHPELQAYLNTHADVREQLMTNPQGFMNAGQPSNNSGQQPSGTGNTNGTGSWSKSSTGTAPATPAPTPAPEKNGTKQ